MTIAGGIMGALFHRERTGEATTVDISLLDTGLWAMGQAMALSLLLDMPWREPPPNAGMSRNPLVQIYQTKDGRYVLLTCCRPASTGRRLCEVIGTPELHDDPRFADHEPFIDNAPVGAELLDRGVRKSKTLDEWQGAARGVQRPVGVGAGHARGADDPQTVANGYLQECALRGRHAVHAGGHAGAVRRRAAAAGAARPSSTSTATRSSPRLGLDWDTIVDLKVKGIVA